MATVVTVPALGPSTHPPSLAAWYVQDGEMVQAGEAVYRIECDFVAVEVEAEVAGILRQRLAPGAVFADGAVAALIFDEGEVDAEGPTLDQVAAEQAAPAAPHLRVIHPGEDEDEAELAPIALRSSLSDAAAAPTRDDAWEIPASERVHFQDDWSVPEDAAAGPADAAAEVEAGLTDSDLDGEPVMEAAVLEPPAAAMLDIAELDEADVTAELDEADVTAELDEADVTAEVDGADVTAELDEAQHVAELEPAAPAMVDIADLHEADGLETELAAVSLALVIEPPPALVTTFAETLSLKVIVQLSEAAKLCAQLTKEWRGFGLTPATEDVVLRASARAASEYGLFEPAAAGLLTAHDEGPVAAYLAGAGRGPLRDAVAALGESSGAQETPPVSFFLTSLASFGIDEGTVPVEATEAFGLSLGISRDGASPAAALTLSYRPSVLSIGEAAALLGRIRDLIEAPYVLLAD